MNTGDSPADAAHQAEATSAPYAPSWLGVSAVAALALFVSLAVAVVLNGRSYFAWDLAVSQAVQSAHRPELDILMHGVSLADNNVLGPTVLLSVACLALAALGRRREAIVLLVLVLTAQGLWVVSGRIVERPRPTSPPVQVLIAADDIHGFPSFPSGHTVYYTAYFGFLWFLVFTQMHRRLFRRPLLVLFGGMVPLVGMARIYLGAHWPTDIVGGYLLGGSVLASGILIHGGWVKHGIGYNTSS